MAIIFSTDVDIPFVDVATFLARRGYILRAEPDGNLHVRKARPPIETKREAPNVYRTAS